MSLRRLFTEGLNRGEMARDRTTVRVTCPGCGKVHSAYRGADGHFHMCSHGGPEADFWHCLGNHRFGRREIVDDLVASTLTLGWMSMLRELQPQPEDDVLSSLILGELCFLELQSSSVSPLPSAVLARRVANSHDGGPSGLPFFAFCDG